MPVSSKNATVSLMTPAGISSTKGTIDTAMVGS